jgi:hypothetical protein
VNSPRGAHIDESTLVVEIVPQSYVYAASAAQKQQGVRSPLLGKYFCLKLDDSTGDVQVIDAMQHWQSLYDTTKSSTVILLNY